MESILPRFIRLRDATRAHSPLHRFWARVQRAMWALARSDDLLIEAVMLKRRKCGSGLNNS